MAKSQRPRFRLSTRACERGKAGYCLPFREDDNRYSVSKTPVGYIALAVVSLPGQPTDGNDFLLMERGICLGLRGETYCGAESTSRSGL